MTGQFLPYGRQAIDEDDVAAVSAVLRGGYLTTGPAVGAFEDAFAARVGAPGGVACSSGTAALHLAAHAVGLGPGRKAIVPAMTFVATANCVRYLGGEVVFADVDPDTGLVTPAAIDAALARAEGDVSAIFVVHLNGQTAPVAEIAAIARHHDAAVIEDACHALGTTYSADGQDHAVGACAHSDAAVFSFHAVKTIACGEGGMITTRSPELADRMARLRHHGMVREPAAFVDTSEAFDATGAVNPWYMEAAELGYNYRLTDIQAALGLSQLAKLDRFADARRALVAAYDAALRVYAPGVRPVARVPSCDPVWHLYAVHVDFAGLDRGRGDVMRALGADGIGTQVHYLPVPWHPCYRGDGGPVPVPGAEAYYRSILSLPLFVGMTASDVERVVAALAAALGL